LAVETDPLNLQRIIRLSIPSISLSQKVRFLEGALTGMEMLIKKATLNGERVLEKGGKLIGGVKSNHYGILKQPIDTLSLPQQIC